MDNTHKPPCAEVDATASILRRQHAELAADIIEVTGESDRGAFYERLIATLPRELVQTALTDTRCAKAAGRIKKSAGAFFIGALKGLAERQGLALQTRASSAVGRNPNNAAANTEMSDPRVQ